MDTLQHLPWIKGTGEREKKRSAYDCLNYFRFTDKTKSPQIYLQHANIPFFSPPPHKKKGEKTFWHETSSLQCALCPLPHCRLLKRRRKTVTKTRIPVVLCVVQSIGIYNLCSVRSTRRFIFRPPQQPSVTRDMPALLCGRMYVTEDFSCTYILH